MYPILAQIGPITLYAYGLMMAIGFWLATEVASREYARRGGDPSAFWRLALVAFLVALVTSHGYWWLREAAAGRAGVRELLSGAGHVWFAGMIGGLIAGWLLLRRRRMSTLDALDSAGLGLPLGHAIGRIGCHLAGDGDWGTITDVPWAVSYERGLAGWPHPPGVEVHPTPLYETIAYLIVFAALWTWRRRLDGGALLGTSLITTSVARFAIEFWRVTPVVAAGWTEAQWVALALVTIGAVLLIRARRAAAPIPG